LYPSKIYAFSTKCSIPTGVRAFSTSNSDSSSSKDSSGLAVFSDADKDKLSILSYVKGKSGIYMWANKLNGKKYVGSSMDLNRRLLEYYNVNRMLNEKSMPINVALLKYGYTNFTLTILDICDKDSLMSREKHFFEVYSPEYNILKIPGSPSRGFGWTHSEAAIENMRIAASKRSKSTEFLTKLSKGQPSGIEIEVTDLETSNTSTYHAIRAAARALDIDKRYIEHYVYLKQDKPVLGRYIFKLKLNSDHTNTNLILEKVQKTSKRVEVTDVETKEVTVYSSITAAARALCYRQASISLHLKDNRTKPFKGKYWFKLVN
jgi:hypothetical protein